MNKFSKVFMQNLSSSLLCGLAAVFLIAAFVGGTALCTVLYNKIGWVGVAIAIVLVVFFLVVVAALWETIKDGDWSYTRRKRRRLKSDEKEMTFKEFSEFCNDRAFDDMWGMADALEMAELCSMINGLPFWKRENAWQNLENRGYYEDRVRAIKEKIQEVLNGHKRV